MSREIGGDGHQLAAVGFHKGEVLRKIGGDGHKFTVRRYGQRPDDRDQSGGSAAGKEQLLRADGHSEAVGQILRHGPAGAVEAAGHGVAVDLNGIGVVQHIQQGLLHRLRGGDAGITQGIVEHVFRAYLRRAAQTVGEQFTDHGGGTAQLFIRRIDHGSSSFS